VVGAPAISGQPLSRNGQFAGAVCPTIARALRAIGQDLNELIPHQVEIVYKEDNFETQVRCDRKRAEKKSPPAEKSGLKNVFHKLATYRLDKAPEGADTATYEHSYHPEEVNQLDRAGLHRRAQAGKVPDINNLGEIVGGSLTHGDASFHGFLYRRHRLYDLNELLAPGGWELIQACAINNRGEIIGVGSYDGKDHIVLLRPKRSGMSRPRR